MRLSDGRVENSLHRLAMLCSDPPASVEHTFARPGNDWFRLDIAVAAGLAKVGNPPTAADFLTITDGPPSTQSRPPTMVARVRRRFVITKSRILLVSCRHSSGIPALRRPV